MELAIAICTRVAEGKPLTRVCRQAGMPGLTAVYAWLAKHVEFAQLMRQARADAGHTFAAQVLEIADEVCDDGVAVQRNRLRVDSRKWVAARMNAAYADRIAIGGATDLPPVQVDQLTGAKSLAFVLARADHMLRQQPRPAAPPPPQVPSVRLEQHPSYRQIMATAETAVDHDLDEDDSALSRIGDPERTVAEPEQDRRTPLSARRTK
jgi:hypothetical protein